MRKKKEEEERGGKREEERDSPKKTTKQRFRRVQFHNAVVRDEQNLHREKRNTFKNEREREKESHKQYKQRLIPT